MNENSKEETSINFKAADALYLNYFLVTLDAHRFEDDANGQIFGNAVVLQIKLGVLRDDVGLAFPLVSGRGHGTRHITLGDGGYSSGNRRLKEKSS